MKKNLLILVVIIISCNTYNDKMNGFLNIKSKVENQIEFAIQNEDLYNRKAESLLLNLDGTIKGEPPPPPSSKQDIEKTEFNEYSSKNIEKIQKLNKLALESNEYKMYMDSVFKYEILKLHNESELKKINYSIDSLSKLK
jgi:hypothetical protein